MQHLSHISCALALVRTHLITYMSLKYSRMFSRNTRNIYNLMLSSITSTFGCSSRIEHTFQLFPTNQMLLLLVFSLLYIGRRRRRKELQTNIESEDGRLLNPTHVCE